jgi:hypothetical protein
LRTPPFRQRVFLDLRLGVAAEGHVDDVSALGDSVVDGLGNVRRGQYAGILRGLYGHDLHIVGYAHAALAIARLRRNDPCHMRPMPMIVHRIARMVAFDAHAMHIVSKSVTVVVAAIVGDFARCQVPGLGVERVGGGARQGKGAN